MKKISVLIISIFAVLTLIYPTNVSALNNNLISNNILIADKEITMDDIKNAIDEVGKNEKLKKGSLRTNPIGFATNKK